MYAVVKSSLIVQIFSSQSIQNISTTNIPQLLHYLDYRLAIDSYKLESMLIVWFDPSLLNV